MDDRSELRQRLLDDCDVEYICESVGVEMRHKSNATEVLCPFHDDRHFGNARIHGKGIYCFACAKQFSVFDIVMKNCDMTYFEAYKFVAEHTGDISDYITKGRKLRPVDQFPLTRDELEFIGLPDGKAKSVICVTDERPTGKQNYDSVYNDDGTWSYEIYQTAVFSMKDVWEASHEDCIEILGDKTCEKASLIHKKLLDARKYDPGLVDVYEDMQSYAVSIYRKLTRKGYRKKNVVLPVLMGTRKEAKAG